MANLCANARDGIISVGKVIIETANASLDKAFCMAHSGCHAGDYVCVAVSDSGSGMDEETMAKLFEPFFTIKEVGKGTGLGLATVYGIVQQNDSAIDVDSKPGKGSIFKIYLPRYGETKASAQNPAENKNALRGEETILLVEDEVGILRMTSSMLENLGYTVLAAPDPKAAVDICEAFSGTIDLLMTDVVMPGMSGRDLAVILLDAHPQMKVLFASGYSDDAIAHHGVLEEGLQFINKPFSKQILSEKIREVLDHASK